MLKQAPAKLEAPSKEVRAVVGAEHDRASLIVQPDAAVILTVDEVDTELARAL